MILSVSRRTDVPAFYLEWFLRRVSEGAVLTRNPLNPRQVRQVSLLPGDVDGIVFWSKNPGPMLPALDALAPFPFYIQYTLNAYGADLEPGLPGLDARLDVFRRLADRLGPSRVLWRYDPILLSPRHSPAFHGEAFSRAAKSLAGYTQTATISFLTPYAKIARAMAAHGLRVPANAEKRGLAECLAGIARTHGLSLRVCAEALDLQALGAGRACCVDAKLLQQIAGRPVAAQRDRNQRPACACAASVDIGAYDTCAHGCVYCYANRGGAAVSANRLRHDPASPFMLPY